MNRCSFLKAGAAFGSVLVLPSTVPGGDKPGTNSRLNLAYIGIGGRSKLTRAVIRSHSFKPAIICYAGNTQKLLLKMGESAALDGELRPCP